MAKKRVYTYMSSLFISAFVLCHLYMCCYLWRVCVLYDLVQICPGKKTPRYFLLSLISVEIIYAEPWPYLVSMCAVDGHIREEILIFKLKQIGICRCTLIEFKNILKLLNATSIENKLHGRRKTT